MMGTKKLSFDTKDCISCSICVQACPISALSLTAPGKSGKYDNFFPQTDYEKCICCGICVKACPMGCITILLPEDEK